MCYSIGQVCAQVAVPVRRDVLHVAGVHAFRILHEGVPEVCELIPQHFFHPPVCGFFLAPGLCAVVCVLSGVPPVLDRVGDLLRCIDLIQVDVLLDLRRLALLPYKGHRVFSCGIVSQDPVVGLLVRLAYTSEEPDHRIVFP